MSKFFPGGERVLERVAWARERMAFHAVGHGTCQQSTSGTAANPAQSAVTAGTGLAAAPAAPPAVPPAMQGIEAPDQSPPAHMPAPSGQPPAGINPPPAENAGGPADPAAIIEVSNMAMVKRDLLDIATRERDRRMFLEAEVAQLRATRGPVLGVAPSSWQLGPPPGLPAPMVAFGPPPGLPAPTPSASPVTATMPSAAPVVAPSSTDPRLARLEGMVLHLYQNGDTIGPAARAALNATEVNVGEQEGTQGSYAYVDRSKFSRILRLYEEAREKEMEHVMAGKPDPFDLWKCIPTIMRVTGNIVEEPAVSVEVGAGGALQVKPKDDQETRKKRLAKLHGYCPNPLAFMNAWTWFIVLIQYWYEDPTLAHDMLRFGWRIVQCNDRYFWHDCLEMFVDIASPILREGLLREHSAMFANADLADVVMHFQQRPDLRMNVNASMRGAGGTSGSASTGRAARIAGYCQNWNRNACNASATGRICAREHLCGLCEGQHPRVECPSAVQRNGNFSNSAMNNNAVQAQLQQYSQMLPPQPQFNPPVVPAIQAYAYGTAPYGTFGNPHFGPAQPQSAPPYGQFGNGQGGLSNNYGRSGNQGNYSSGSSGQQNGSRGQGRHAGGA
ncbi:hypothetical protein QFC20_001051 [Naganishia adeliensis]|uniref:Uncharacterized protein n=1 Tax=Naganishia adeliensis TaxID=92952 RepID=A0ACC2WVL6_9TREE|nr:hypothetical protein QFC20_001051 [Naganishia adeliensis]